MHWEGQISDSWSPEGAGFLRVVGGRDRGIHATTPPTQGPLYLSPSFHLLRDGSIFNQPVNTLVIKKIFHIGNWQNATLGKHSLFNSVEIGVGCLSMGRGRCILKGASKEGSGRCGRELGAGMELGPVALKSKGHWTDVSQGR